MWRKNNKIFHTTNMHLEKATSFQLFKKEKVISHLKRNFKLFQMTNDYLITVPNI